MRIANVLTIIKLNINVYFPSNARAEAMRKTIATNTADLILFHVKQKATKYPRNRPKPTTNVSRETIKQYQVKNHKNKIVHFFCLLKIIKI